MNVRWLTYLRGLLYKFSSFRHRDWCLLTVNIKFPLDLDKVAQTGYRLNRVNENVENIWQKLEQQNLMLPALIRQYASFVKSLLFDKSESQRLYNMIKTVKNNKNFAVASEGDLSNDSVPTIVLSASDVKYLICKAKRLNFVFSRLTSE